MIKSAITFSLVINATIDNYLYIKLFMRKEIGVKLAEANIAMSGLDSLNAICFTSTAMPNSMVTLKSAFARRLGQVFMKFLKDR